MQYLKFRLSTDDLIALHKDVEKALGGKPIGQPAQIHENQTTNTKSKLLFGYNLPDDFLDNHPQWSHHVER
jgi:hypothetical protein